MHIIIAAILYLAPHVTPTEAWVYAKQVKYESEQAAIHPLLAVAVIQMESGFNAKAKGPTSDYGLFQVVVSKNQYSEFIGSEAVLYDPVLNIHLGFQLMRYWRDHHYRSCFGKRHPWWSHMKWGHKVKDGGKSARERAGSLYARLLAKYGPDV